MIKFKLNLFYIFSSLGLKLNIMGIFDKYKKKRTINNTKNESHNNIEKELTEKESILQDISLIGEVSNYNFIKSETKFESQETEVKRSSPDNPLTLEYIIRELLEINPDYCGSLFIASRNIGQQYTTHEIKERDIFLKYNPFDAILRKNEKGELLPRTSENVTLIISYRPLDLVFGEAKPDESKYNVDNSIIIFLRGFGLLAETNKTVFMRASIMIPNFIDEDDTKPFTVQNIPTTKSFIFCYDITDPKERLENFHEINQSLDRKMKNYEPINQEEKEILDSRWNYRTPEEFLGKGEWLFNQKRYYDALIYLKRAYDEIKKLYYKDSYKYKSLMPRICFLIGFSYAEFKQFDKALFYLDIARFAGSLHIEKEYISVLSSSLSPKTFRFVEEYMAQFEAEGNWTLERIEFYEFLIRRAVWLNMEFKNWEAAKNYIQLIKDSKDPMTQKFVEDEIRYMISKGVYN